MNPLPALLSLTLVAGDPEITGIGGLVPGGASWTAALSEDGGTAVGLAHTGLGLAAVRWTRKHGLERVHPPAWTYESWATDVSADGSVVVGGGSDDLGVSQAFAWREATGVSASLGFIEGGLFSTARTVLDDGSLVMGLASDDKGVLQLVTWLNEGDTLAVVDSGIRGLILDPRSVRRLGRENLSWVGTARHVQGQFSVPVRWSHARGLERIPDAAGRSALGVANDMSHDGVSVGWQVVGSETLAFVHTPDEGIQYLDTFVGWSSYATAVSGDGLRVVGFYKKGGIKRAIIWDRRPGGEFEARDPITLIGSGASASWVLLSIVDVSIDGETMTGVGKDLKAAATRGWVARIPRG